MIPANAVSGSGITFSETLRRNGPIWSAAARCIPPSTPLLDPPYRTAAIVEEQHDHRPIARGPRLSIGLRLGPWIGAEKGL